MKNKKSFMRFPLFLIGIFLLFASGCEKDASDGYDSANNTLTDSRDGTVYKTVSIGGQVWMAANLTYKLSNGNYWAYDNDNVTVETYGYLYDWQTALNVCPAGWHLPTDEEWTH